MRQCTVLEWFVLITVERFANHSRYYQKTLSEVAEDVLGLYAGGPIFTPVCRTLLKCGAIEVDGDLDVNTLELQYFSITEKGHQAIISKTLD